MSSASVAVAASGEHPPRSPFKRSFWVANTMEIFERLAWYGFFAVSSLYITGSRSEGALGFTSEQRGVLQGVVPFILYLLPVVFGALGDRFGYKKTFMAAYTVLVPAYYLLGRFTAFGTFFMAFLFVAVGAAIFKPVVVGTVARTTDETNSSMGFGIFYMMVNVGGFIGPIVAGIVRVRFGWDWVFVASAFWIACNFIWLFVFYKEPTTEAASAQKRTIKQVLSGIVEVLGNGRFFIMVFFILAMLAISGKKISWTLMGEITAGWVLLNLLIDLLLRKKSPSLNPPRAPEGQKARPWFLQPMKVGNWKFALYLLILSGFWTSFNQIFLTMPEYIRDYVETQDMVRTARSWFGENFARGLAAVNEDLLQDQVGQFVSEKSNTLDARIRAVQDGAYLAAFDTIPHNQRKETLNPRSLEISAEDAAPFVKHLYDFKVRLPVEDLRSQIGSLPLEYFRADDGEGRALLGQLRGASPASKSSKQIISNFLSGYVEARYPRGAATAMANGQGTMTISETVAAKLDSAQRIMNLDDRKMGYLLGGVVFVPPPALKAKAHGIADQYRQVNPEYIINIDAGAIVIFQVLVSYIIGFYPPLSVMVIGIIIAAVGIGMNAWLFTGWLVILSITIFAFGEMIASPKSQEYVGRIAPQQKVAMYMGFYFWTVALGNIFGGRLSGELYGSLARDAGRPDIMWYIFGGLGLLTAGVLIIYDRAIIGKGKME